MSDSGHKSRKSKSAKHHLKKRKFKQDKDNYNAKINRLDRINKDHFPSGFDTRVLSKKPYIVKVRRFMNTEEIETVIAMTKGKFQSSKIIVSDEMIESSTRTSKTAFITDNGHHETYSKPIERILKKVCYLAGCKRNQIENLMVVKYGEGDEYYDHHDYFTSEHIEIISDGGQRIATFFCYLNSLDPDDGGETEFPLIEAKVKPSKGTAVFWWNVTPSGKLIDDTLHRGNPVKRRTKYGMNIWIREHGW